MSTSFKRIESIIKPILDTTGDRRDFVKPLTNEQLLSVWQDLVDYDSQNQVAQPITFVDLYVAITNNSVTPNRMYEITDFELYSGHTGSLFVRSLDTNKIAETGTFLFQSSFDYAYRPIKIELAFSGGNFESYNGGIGTIKDEAKKLHWEGNSVAMGSTGSAFLSTILNSELYPGVYENITVKYGCVFSGSVPQQCVNTIFNTANYTFSGPVWLNRTTFGISDEGYSLGANTNMFNVVVSNAQSPYSGGLTTGNDCRLVNCKLGCSIHTLGNTVILTGITTVDGVTVTFPDNCNVSDGVVGGRGCSASYNTTIDLSGGDSLNLSGLPLCKTYKISNVSASGIKEIVGWFNDANIGAEIILLPATTQFLISVTSGINIGCSGAGFIVTGGGDATVQLSAFVRLMGNGNAYLTDYM